MGQLLVQGLAVSRTQPKLSSSWSEAKDHCIGSRCPCRCPCTRLSFCHSRRDLLLLLRLPLPLPLPVFRRHADSELAEGERPFALVLPLPLSLLFFLSFPKGICFFFCFCFRRCCCRCPFFAVILERSEGPPHLFFPLPMPSSLPEEIRLYPTLSNPSQTLVILKARSPGEPPQ